MKTQHSSMANPLAAALGPIGGLAACACCLLIAAIWGLFATTIALAVYTSRRTLSPCRFVEKEKHFSLQRNGKTPSENRLVSILVEFRPSSPAMLFWLVSSACTVTLHSVEHYVRRIRSTTSLSKLFLSLSFSSFFSSSIFKFTTDTSKLWLRIQMWYQWTMTTLLFFSNTMIDTKIHCSIERRDDDDDVLLLRFCSRSFLKKK